MEHLLQVTGCTDNSRDIRSNINDYICYICYRQKLGYMLVKALTIHKENTKEIMSMKESVYSDTEFC